MFRCNLLVCCLILLCAAANTAAAAPGGRASTGCSDPDNEGTSTAAKDHNQAGTTAWTAYPKAGPPSQQSGVDTCKTPKLLYEYHCEQYKGTNQLPTDTTNMRALIDCSVDGAVCLAGRCVIPVQDGGDNSCTAPCPTGTMCKQGKCIPPEENVSCEGSCGVFGCPACTIDTEGCIHVNGDDPLGSAFTGGTIQFAQGAIKGIPATDECIDASWLLEYNCENGAKTETTIQCAEGCDDSTGTCQKTGCIDPDAGAGSVDVLWESFDLEYASATTTTQHNQYGQVIDQKADACADEWHVKEAYCNGNTPNYKSGECPESVFGYKVFDGCCGGACYVAKNKCIDTDSATDNGLAPKTAGALFVGKGCGIPPEAARDTCGLAKIGNPFGGGSQVKSYMSTGDYGDSVKEFYCDGLEVKSVWVFCGGETTTTPLGATNIGDVTTATSATKLPSAKYPQKTDATPAQQPKKNLIAACQQGQCTTLPRCTRTEQKFWASSTTGLLVIGGHAELTTRNDECLNDTTLREYRCADGMQGTGIATTNFAQPALYMIPASKSCKKGCDLEQGKCTEDVIDLGKKLIPVWPRNPGGIP